MTTNEILALTGASIATLYRWRNHRDFPPMIAVGVYNRAAVEGWWAANEDQVGRWPFANRVGTNE